MSKKIFDIDEMAQIISVLLEKFKDNKLVHRMINHLIRDESDYLVPTMKSTEAVKLEQEYNVSLKNLPRNAIWPKDRELSSRIEIEHGLTISEAVEKCIKAHDREGIAVVLEELKGSLVYIADFESAVLAEKGFSKIRKEGFMEAYEKCGIILVQNK